MGIALLTLLALVVVMPVWIPWVLGPVASRLGIHYQQLEREGYTRFRIRNLAFTNAEVRLEVRRGEVLTPVPWLWRRFKSQTELPYAQVEGWKLSISESNRKSPSPGPRSVYTNYHKIERVVGTVLEWVPKAILADGVIEIENHPLQVSRAVLNQGRLVAAVAAPKFRQTGEVVFDWAARSAPGDGGVPPGLPAELPRRHAIQLDSPTLDLRTSIIVSSGADGLEIRGTSFWLTNRVEMATRFDRSGIMPVSARLLANSLTIPAARLKLPEYQDLRGSLSAYWETNRFVLDVNAAALPHAQFTNLPPLEAKLHAAGDTNRAWIESARISAPWLHAELSRPARVQFASPYLAEPVAAVVEADLSRQPWFAARGRLSGKIQFEPAAGKYPNAAFTFSGAAMSFRMPPGMGRAGAGPAERGTNEIAAKSIELSGQFNWPQLELAKGEVLFVDGSSASVHGRIDVEQKTVQEARAQFEGGYGRQWLPSSLAYERARLTANLSGPWDQLNHSGELEVEAFRAPRLNPVRLKTRWQGRQLQLSELQITAIAGDSLLLAGGAAAWGPAGKQIQVRTLTLQKAGQPLLELARPFAASFTNQAANAWRVHLEPFDWQGGNRAVHLAGDLAWPSQGRVSAAIQNLDLKLFGDFVPLPWERAAVALLDLSAGWEKGPVELRLGLGVEFMDTKADPPLSAAVQFSADGNGTAVEKLVLATHEQPAVTAHGFLPVIFQSPASGRIIQVDPRRRLELSAGTQPNPYLWDQVARWTGIGLREPGLKVDLTGTLEAPQGRITLAAARFEPLRLGRPAPPLEGLFIQLDLDRERARLAEFRLLVARQPVTASGELPLGKEFWDGLGNRNLNIDWKQASGRLRIPPAELAAFGEWLPQAIQPQGELMANLALQPGGALHGELRLAGARTRPLADLGPVRDIQARLAIHGRTVSIEQISADIGGQAVQAHGTMQLPPELWPKSGLPATTLYLRGNRVPLARRPEVILRADLDLVLTNAPGQPPTIAGDVRLRDSFYLSDLRDLMPGKVASPRQRPPYFSLDTEPLADWRLNLRVQGREFMTLRSTFFRGAVSTTLKLEGTLKEPVALGDVNINSGTVRFPFASFEVTQGLLTLTSDNPYRPQLYVNARSKRAGYEVRLEVTGPADDPVLQFNSSPPLSQDDILMMITAGRMPVENARLSTTSRAQTLALFVGRDVLSELGLGSGNEERLTIRSGEEVTLQGRPTYEVEYKLSKDWSIFGEYDRFNQYNAGLKWRIYSK